MDRSSYEDDHFYLPGEMREPLFQNVCNGKIKGNGTGYYMLYDQLLIPRIYPRSKCHLVHHFAPFLKLGPFHLEVKLYSPFRTVIHDFFTNKEMDWLMDYSKPRLSAARGIPDSTTSQRGSATKLDDFAVHVLFWLTWNWHT